MLVAGSAVKRACGYNQHRPVDAVRSASSGGCFELPHATPRWSQRPFQRGTAVTRSRARMHRSSYLRPGNPALSGWGAVVAAALRFCLLGADESPITRSNHERCSGVLGTGGGPSSANRREDGGRWLVGPPRHGRATGLARPCRGGPTQAVNWPADTNPVMRCGRATVLAGGTVIRRRCKPLAWSYGVVGLDSSSTFL
jgi:hypothetical protein